MRIKHLLIPGIAVLSLAGASEAVAAGGGAAAGSSAKSNQSVNSGGASVSGGGGGGQQAFKSTASHPEVRGYKAKIIHGKAYAPSMAPIQVKRAIWAGNRIRSKPYIYGGGHGSFNDSGYDCSGSVSYVLHGAHLLSAPLDSGEFMSWGARGRGHWITVFGSANHAFIEVAGIVFDTAHYTSTTPGGSGPRWQPVSIMNSQLHDGNSWATRHPKGL